MKNLNIKPTVLTILLAIIATATLLPNAVKTALAAESINTHLKVAAPDQILFDDDFTINSCPNTDNASSTDSTINAWCAIDQLVAAQNWNATSTWYSFGVMLNSINQYNGNDGNYWLWFSESEPGETSLNQHILTTGENLLLTYGTGPLKLTASSSTPPINSTTTLAAFYFDANSWQWTAIATSSTFIINGQEITSANGTYEFITATTTPYVIQAKKDGFIESEKIIITPQLPTVNIKLRVETAASTLYNQDLTVAACEGTTASGAYSLNGRCALDQSGLFPQWSSWGSDLFLDSLGGTANNADGNGIYWNWFENLNYGTVALNNHILTNNEELLLTYNRNPLRISATTSTPYLNSTTTLTLEKFDFDAGWNPTWQVAATSTFIINGQEFFSVDGTLALFIATTSPYEISAKNDGYLDSRAFIVTGISPPQATTTPAENPENQPSGPDNSGNGGSGNSTGAAAHQTINLNRAINFLIANQNPDGSIGSSILYSDWSAIALAAYGESEAKNKLKNYLITSDYATDPGSRAADLERRAMALMALEINPYGGTGTDYIAAIAAGFDGKQIGDPDIFNDDIFALIPLLRAGYSGTDEIIDKTIRFIISKQNPGGSWDGIDLTAAAMQALALARKTGSLSNSLNDLINTAEISALNFLRASQRPNGSFNDNAISTSWAAQGIAALGETPSAWENNGKNPLDFLAAAQASDGGLESAATAIGTRIWTTAYAIPATMNKTWGDILFAFTKPLSSPALNSAGAGQNSSVGNIIATSTPDTAFATSTTPANITNATSTPIAVSPNPNIGGDGPEIKNQTAETELAPTRTKSAGPARFSLAGDKKIDSGTTPVPATPSEQTAKPAPEQSPEIKKGSLNLQAQAAGPIISGHSSAKSAAKIIFYTSSAAVVSLGLYFGIKLLLGLFL